MQAIKSLLAAFAILAGVAASSANANDVLSPVPAAVWSRACSDSVDLLDGVVDTSFRCFRVGGVSSEWSATVSLSHGGSVDAGSDWSVGFGNYVSGYASATLTYYFVILQIDPTISDDSVPLHVYYNINASAGGDGSPYASATAIFRLGTDAFSPSFTRTVCSGACPQGFGDHGDLDILNLDATIARVGSVTLEATAGAGTPVGGNSASAFADPYLFVDPTFVHAANYRIVVSDGVDNSMPVPEPETWTMLLAGLVCMGSILRRGRGHPRSQ